MTEQHHGRHELPPESAPRRGRSVFGVLAVLLCLLLGVAIAGLLAAFMAGMAANISAFNTVFSYDIWQEYVVKERDDAYYIRIGRIMTVVATVVAIFTSFLAASYENAMSYLQTLFGFQPSTFGVMGIFAAASLVFFAEPEADEG